MNETTQDVEHIEAGQDQPRYDRAAIHVADRAAQLVSQHDQHQRGRDDLRQRARGGDDTRGDAAVIAVAQHDRQRDKPHRDDAGRDHAGRGRQQRAHQHHGIGKPAPDRAEKLANGIQQVLGHAGSLQDDPHEGEEGDGQQGVIRHDPPQSLRHGVKQRPIQRDRILRQRCQPDAEGKEDQPVRGERKGDRISKQQENHEACEHDGRHVLGDKLHHDLISCASACASISACSLAVRCGVGSGMMPRITAIFLTISEKP